MILRRQRKGRMRCSRDLSLKSSWFISFRSFEALTNTQLNMCMPIKIPLPQTWQDKVMARHLPPPECVHHLFNSKYVVLDFHINLCFETLECWRAERQWKLKKCHIFCSWLLLTQSAQGAKDSDKMSKVSFCQKSVKSNGVQLFPPHCM